MSKKIKADDLSGEITKIVKYWSDEVNEEVSEAIIEVANDSKDRLKVEGDFQNRSGKYRKGWQIEIEEQRLGLVAIVHNRLFQLTHLLESGHAKWLWGRNTGQEVQAFPHIEKVNEEAQKRVEEEIKRRLS